MATFVVGGTTLLRVNDAEREVLIKALSGMGDHGNVVSVTGEDMSVARDIRDLLVKRGQED